MKNYISKLGSKGKIAIFYKQDSQDGGRRLVEHNLVSSDFNPVEDVGKKNTVYNFTFSIYQSEQFTDITETANQIISILGSSGLVVFGHQRLGVSIGYVDSYSHQYTGGSYSFDCSIKEYVEEGYEVKIDDKVGLIDTINQLLVTAQESVDELISLADTPADVVNEVNRGLNTLIGIMKSVISLADKPQELLDRLIETEAQLSALTNTQKLEQTATLFSEVSPGSVLSTARADSEVSYLTNSYFFVSGVKKIVQSEINEYEEVELFLEYFNDFIFYKTKNIDFQNSLVELLSEFRGLFAKGELNTQGKQLLECKGKPYLVAWYDKYKNLDNAFESKNIDQVVDINNCEEDLLIYEN